MSQGGAYDQATRAVPLPIADAREQAVQAAVEQGTTYSLARGRIAEPVEVVSARWSKHQLAMRDGGSHEAGWAASARR
jgi:hypothetical protein